MCSYTYLLLVHNASVRGFPFDLETADKVNISCSPMWMDTVIADIQEDNFGHLFCVTPQAGSGMAGASVWLSDESEVSPKDVSLRCVAGVYSGSNVNDTSAGKVWGIDVVWELLENPRQGLNPKSQPFQNSKPIEEHNLNGSYFGSDEVFIHFTMNRETLLSILNFGLLYLHNESEIFVDLIGSDLNIDSEPETSGMVCFADLLFDELKSLRDTENTLSTKLTGYGIAVDKTWAIENGAGRVIYLDEAGSVYRCLRKLFRLSLPDNLIGSLL